MKYAQLHDVLGMKALFYSSYFSQIYDNKNFDKRFYTFGKCKIWSQWAIILLTKLRLNLKITLKNGLILVKNEPILPLSTL